MYLKIIHTPYREKYINDFDGFDFFFLYKYYRYRKSELELQNCQGVKILKAKTALHSYSGA